MATHDERNEPALPEQDLPNPFVSAVQEFNHTKEALADARVELLNTKLSLEDANRQLAVMNERYEAYKATVTAEVGSLRKERDWLQAYTQTLRTRIAVATEILNVVLRDAEQYATRVVSGREVATDEEVVDSIRNHFQREKDRQERDDTDGRPRPFIRQRKVDALQHMDDRHIDRETGNDRRFD